MQTLITNPLIKSLRPQEKPYEIRDTKLKGLILRVQPSGIMTYYVEYKRGSREKLGRADAITPFEARDIAKLKLADFCQGKDPAEQRRLAKADTYLLYLETVYKPWLLGNLKTGNAAFMMLKASFADFHGLKLHEITPWQIEKWRMKRQNDGAKPATINRELAALKACLKRATEWGYLKKHAIENVKLCKLDNNGKVRYLLPDEEDRLRKQLDLRQDDHRKKRTAANQWRAERQYPLLPDLSETPFTDYLKPAVLLSLNTGLRRGELFGLKWSSVDFQRKNLTVVAETAKSGKTRHLPLNPEAFQIIQAWRSQCDETTVYVFEGPDGKPLHDVRTSWSGLLKDAKITNFRWHDLRHDFASKLVMAGVDLNTVREFMGHSDYDMTLRYAHLTPEHKANAMLKLLTQRKISKDSATLATKQKKG